MKKNKWFVIQKPKQNPKARLICFPYAAGNASTYQEWHNNISDDIEIISIQPPGRANRILEEPIDNMQELVGELLKYASDLTHIPYFLFGHSLGSRVGYEFTVQLQKLGYPMPMHFIASGSRAPHLASNKRHIHNLPLKEFVIELRKLSGTPEEILQNDELIELLLPLLRADFKIAENYRTKKYLLTCPITVLGGIDDIGVPKDSLEAWGELTHLGVTVLNIEGGHFFVESERASVLDAINSIISKQVFELPNLYLASSVV
ncbi:thioesterase [Pseudoalteromonas sp. NBT06-2]|uniref:thioesterase II family protein n=1 Tax=Pseudoalteromonas sp. NBT06-2 TaxID=2025950 RepID=UPI0014829721|nr:thioesterase [Pseudoalteromonas sp. NBT06-2]